MASRTWAVGLGAAGLLVIAGLTDSSIAGPRMSHAQIKAGAEAVETAVTDDPHLKPNPDVITGVLPNGLRYVLAKNDDPKGGLSLRLAMDVGLYDEEPADRGVAHFVEHMNFNGSKVMSAEEAEKAFLAGGVQFGRDQNAATALYNTTYRLDLKQNDKPTVDLAFRWLRGVADGAMFDPRTVDRERGVLQAERGSRATPTYQSGVTLLTFLAPGMRSTDRGQLDPAESLAKMDAGRLSAFYQRWYRPERAIVIVVGDLPTDEMKKRVEDTFGSWKGQGPAPTRAPFGKLPSGRGMEAVVRPTGQSANQFNVCRVMASDDPPISTMEGLRRRMLSRIWITGLNTRLQALAAGQGSPFLGAYVISLDYGEQRFLCISGVPLGDKWAPAMAAAQKELRKVAESGLDDAEIASARATVDYKYSDEVGISGDSPTRASALANTALKGEISPGEEEEERIFFNAVGKATAKDIKEAFARDWTGNGPLIQVVSDGAVDPAAVRAAWQDGEKTQLAAEPVADPKAASAETKTEWPYPDFGKPGKVAKKEVFKDHAFTRYTFANGAILNVKTKGVDEVVQVRVRFGAGRQELANGDYLVAQMAVGLLPYGGLGRMDYDGLQKNWGGPTLKETHLTVGNDAFVLWAMTFKSSGLRQQLQAMAAMMTDPGFRPYADTRLPTAVDMVYRMSQSNPQLALSLALQEAIAPGGPETLPPKDKIIGINSGDFARVLKPVLLGDPVEITVVGRIKEGDAVRFVAQTFGALPPRELGSRARPGAWVRRFPDKPIPAIRLSIAAAEGSVVGEVWPLFAPTPARRKEEYAIRLLAPMLDLAVRDRLRFKLGKTYSDGAFIAMDDGPDQGFLLVGVEATGADADLVAAEMIKAAMEMAGGKLDPVAFAQAKADLLKTIDAEGDEDSLRWAEALDGSARDPGRVADRLARKAMVESITIEDVAGVAGRWLTANPVLLLASPAAPAPH